MRPPTLPRSPRFPTLLAAAVLGFMLVPGPARAERDHVVRAGQSLARVAQRYGVSVEQLAAANQLEPKAALRAGQLLTVPSPGEVYVRAGDTIARIARKHDVSSAELAKENRLRADSPLRVGQRLVLPGHASAEARHASEERWGRPRRPGVATLVRVWSKERKQLRLVDSRGRVPRTTITALRQLLRPRDSRRRRDPDRRLVQLLARVSDHFGGRTIHVVSGYRLPGGSTQETSRHVQGSAIDFRIPGVPVDAIRDLCASFERVGVGYYPTGGFVHLDVRERNARWTDWSGPGEPARLDAPDPEAEGGEASETDH